MTICHYKEFVCVCVGVCVCFVVAGIDLHHFNDYVKVHNVFIIRIQIPRS